MLYRGPAEEPSLVQTLSCFPHHGVSISLALSSSCSSFSPSLLKVIRVQSSQSFRMLTVLLLQEANTLCAPELKPHMAKKHNAANLP